MYNPLALKRLLSVPVPPCPDDSGLREPLRKFEDTHSFEVSFIEYHFNFKPKKEQ